MIPIKEISKLLGAMALGLWLGINYMGALIDPKVNRFGDAPPWVSEAETMAIYALVVLAVCVVAWIAIDYWEHHQLEESETNAESN